MLTRRVIPCLDCRDGRVVKGVRFSGLRDVGSPIECAAAYEAQGADEIILLDVTATSEGRENQVETVRAVREVLSIPLTVGGGIRRAEDARRLLEVGADKVAINTAAVRDATLVDQIAQQFGCQCAVLAVDAVRNRHAGWQVAICSGKQRTDLDVIAWCRAAVQRGAGEILLTSWDRDGTRSGYDLDLLAAVTSVVTVPVIASGGAATPHHLAEALRAGADAVLAASIFHEAEYTVSELKDYLAQNEIEVRR